MAEFNNAAWCVVIWPKVHNRTRRYSRTVMGDGSISSATKSDLRTTLLYTYIHACIHEVAWDYTVGHEVVGDMGLHEVACWSVT